MGIKDNLTRHSGTGQQWVAPKAGIYSFECWGASGGAATVTGGTGSDYPGKGAYTYGRTTLAVSNTFYVFVGGVGVRSYETNNYGAGWNGGGYCYNADYTTGGANYWDIGGGGATDIRLSGNTNATWKNETHLRSRVMVAAGGGGVEHYSGYRTTGGYAGGLIGGQGYNNTSTNGYSNYTEYPNSGATQISTGNYYVAGNGHNPDAEGYFGYAQQKFITGGWGGGGGGGYWGGVRGYGQGGSGGSSYISGHAGCIAITSASDTSPKGGTNTTTNLTVDRATHYSGRYFSSTRMVDGEGKAWTTSRASTATGMPKPTSSGTENGHLGDGYARITYIPN